MKRFHVHVSVRILRPTSNFTQPFSARRPRFSSPTMRSGWWTIHG